MTQVNTETSIKAFLNSLSSLPGSILYRDSLAWKGLAPGEAGQVLSLDDNLFPIWGQGARYNPAIVDYNATSNHMEGNFTSVGNQVTAFFRFKRSSFSGNTLERPFIVSDPTQAGDKLRVMSTVFSNDRTDATTRDKLIMVSRSSTGGFGCVLYSKLPVCDGQDHLVAFSFDGDTGSTVFLIDGQDADDLTNPNRVTPVPVTLGSGANSKIWLAKNFAGPFYNGTLGMTGYQESFIPDFSSFPSNPESIWKIDETTWKEWVTPPEYWNAFGLLNDNKGTKSNASSANTPNLITGN